MRKGRRSQAPKLNSVFLFLGGFRVWGLGVLGVGFMVERGSFKPSPRFNTSPVLENSNPESKAVQKLQPWPLNIVDSIGEGA